MPLSSSSSSLHPCKHSPSATLDLLILILVVFSGAFLISSYFSYLIHSLSLLSSHFPSIALSLSSLPLPLILLFSNHDHDPDDEDHDGISLASFLFVFAVFFAASVAFLDLCCGSRSRRCRNPKCKGLKKAMEFDLQLQTEESVRTGSGKEIERLPWKGGSESNPDYECLRAELRKMAPINGRAVLLFRSRCGCPVAKLEGRGPKRSRRHKKLPAKLAARCFSAAITQSRQQPYTTSPTPTHFDFSGSESSDIERALISALGSCATNKDVTYGRQIHCRVLKSGFDSNGFICNSLLNMYAKCRVLSEAESVFCSHTKLDSASFNIMIDGYVRSRRIRDALKLFDVMPDRSCVSYTTLIKGYAQNDRWSEAMELFREMRSSGVMLNEVTLATVVSACSHLGGVWDCRMLHSLAIRLNLEGRVFVSTNLLHMYCICSCLEDARKLFDGMPERNLVTWNVMLNGYSKAGLVEEAKELFDQITEKDIVSWGTMIDGCLRKNQLEEALVFYKEMLRRGMKPSEVMMVDLLSASARSSGGFNGLQLHCTIVKTGFDCYDFIQATIIHFYAVCNNIKLAIRQFEASVMDHIASRNALIAGFVKNGMVEEAREVFDQTREKDIFSWNAMISGYAQSLSPNLALHLFREMISSSQVKPDAITMVSVFSAISSLGSLEEGIRAHEYLNRSSIPPNNNLTAAVIDMYAKCGSIETALNVFRQTKNISSSTISPWNAIICGSATHGHAKLALDLYSELQSLPIKPNSITFVGVLSAGCHAGLVELGKTYFDSMKEVHGIEPDIKHYGCMVDLLGKAGRLEEAIDMIKKMPVKADVIIWGILLSASRIHRNVEVAEMAASELAAIEPTHEGCKVLLSNVYADAGRWEDVALVREEMRTSDVEWSRAFSGVV
uniref:Ribosomal protein L34e superfamily protein n=1 Tax=Brassica oleracea var. oleracea TaxID=109376 RepID=A0A0D3EE78_BRAOL